MAQRTILVCDQCGQERRAENHWFEIKLVGEAIIIAPMGKMLWPDEGAAAVSHLCGEACVSRTVSEFLGGATKTETRKLGVFTIESSRGL